MSKTRKRPVLEMKWWADKTSLLAHAAVGKSKKSEALCGHLIPSKARLSDSLKPRCPDCAAAADALGIALEAAKSLDRTLVNVGKVLAAREFYEDTLGYKVGGLHRLIPEGSLETARIMHRECKEDHIAFDNLREVVNGNPERVMVPGKFTILHTTDAKGNWEIMMSDTSYEMFVCAPFMEKAHGHVLVLGLGLGATLLPVLKNPNVHSVRVIEKNKDVIELVQPHLMKMEGARKLTIIWNDCTRWKPPKKDRYNTIWIDIWPEVSLRNLPELLKLKKKYSKYLASESSWIGAWEERRLRLWLKEEKEEVDPLQAVGGPIPTEVSLGETRIKL